MPREPVRAIPARKVIDVIARAWLSNPDNPWADDALEGLPDWVRHAIEDGSLHATLPDGDLHFETRDARVPKGHVQNTASADHGDWLVERPTDKEFIPVGAQELNVKYEVIAAAESEK